MISWDVIFVLVVMRRKSANHWGEAWSGEEGERSGFGFDCCFASDDDLDG